jgi:MoxR-like ATPase
MNVARSNMPSPSAPAELDAGTARRALEAVVALRARLHESLAPVIVGQRGVLDDMIATLLCRGHCLLEGVPGLAKTLMVKSLADALALDFGRIQFTPDLMPADITGTEVLEDDRASGGRRLRFLPGPVFKHVLLADEINRAPPKTQAALLEAMQEGQATVGGVRHPLPQPFFVLATRNPIEQEGTYPLPEGQLDRFLVMLRVDYPHRDEEMEIVRRTTGPAHAAVQPVVDGLTIDQASEVVRSLPVAEHVLRAAIDLVRATRPGGPEAPRWLADLVRYGAGPRASQALMLVAKAHAALAGRPCVEVDDVRRSAAAVLRHRLVLSFAAESDGVSADAIIERLLRETIPGRP